MSAMSGLSRFPLLDCRNGTTRREKPLGAVTPPPTWMHGNSWTVHSLKAPWTRASLAGGSGIGCLARSAFHEVVDGAEKG